MRRHELSSRAAFLLPGGHLAATEVPRSTEVLSQHHAGAVQLGLRRARRDSEQRCDLGVLVTLDVVKHEYLARAVGELLERRLEVHRDVAPSGRRGQRFEDRITVDQAL